MKVNVLSLERVNMLFATEPMLENPACLMRTAGPEETHVDF